MAGIALGSSIAYLHHRSASSFAGPASTFRCLRNHTPEWLPDKPIARELKWYDRQVVTVKAATQGEDVRQHCYSDSTLSADSPWCLMQAASWGLHEVLSNSPLTHPVVPLEPHNNRCVGTEQNKLSADCFRFELGNYFREIARLLRFDRHNRRIETL